MSPLRSLAGVTAIGAIALIAASCEANRQALAPTMGAPRFHFFEFQCQPLKMTGGGRIDYPPGKFEILTVDMTAPGYPPVNFTISAKEGIFGPDLPVRLKRE